MPEQPKRASSKKCEKDAEAQCEMAAAEKKPEGAAKTDNVNKSVKDAMGNVKTGFSP